MPGRLQLGEKLRLKVLVLSSVLALAASQVLAAEADKTKAKAATGKPAAAAADKSKPKAATAPAKASPAKAAPAKAAATPGKPAGKAHAVPPPPKKKPAEQARQTVVRPPAKLAFTTLSPADHDLAASAMRAVEAGRYDEARALALRCQSEIPLKLVTWLWLQRPGNGASFEEIAGFADAHADWPARDTLLRRAEEALAREPTVPDARVVAWFADHEATTGEGRIRKAEALIRLGQVQPGNEALRNAWITGNFSVPDEAALLRRYDGAFSLDDHKARLDRLLWERQVEPARRMLAKNDGDTRKLAEARLALILRAPHLDAIVAAVPPALQNDPGLVYERLRYSRDKGSPEALESVLLASPMDSAHAEKWWAERYVRARTALAEGRSRDAYRLASSHGPLDNRSMVEAEWFSGWIALRRLADASTAAKHFLTAYDIARFPVSKARAAYWIARSAEVMGDSQRADEWYAEAARNPATYYGQLALSRNGATVSLDLPRDPEPTAAQVKSFEQRPLIRATRALAELNETDRLRAFILRLQEQAEQPEEHQMVVRLALALARPDLGVAAAKRAAQRGVLLVDGGYPVIDALAAQPNPEPAAILALSRQESEFNQYAVSPAGARGLMQLMPATAKEVARNLQLGYEPAWLTSNPGYNAKLGSHYLAQMLNNWDGSYALALASYNAGEARARKWIKDFGDPRQATVDVIDWVELIPFSETRNYVQRVTESLQVYRHRLAPGRSSVQLEADLRGRNIIKASATP
jgi:soluble lytic murein transglycosylase